MTPLRGTALAAGRADAELVVLDEPLSFWGGSDVASGTIVDARHPQAGRSLAGVVVALPDSRGSSSSSSVLAEQLRLGVAPAAVLLRRPDAIVTLAAIVAAELYGIQLPIVVLDDAAFAQLAEATAAAVVAGEQAGEVTLR